MASIIDSFKEVFSDRFSFIKLAVLAAPVYYSYQSYLQSKGDFTNFFWIAGITLFFMFGFFINVTSNVINERDFVLPSLNPFKIAFSAVKGIVALAPISYILYLAANYICSFINIIAWIDTPLKTMIWIVVAGIILTSFLIFVARENILDPYKIKNLKVLFEKSGDLIMVTIFFLIQLAVINVIISGFIGYTLLLLFGQGVILDSFIVFAAVFNLAVAGHYLGQANYDVIEYGKKSNS